MPTLPGQRDEVALLSFTSRTGCVSPMTSLFTCGVVVHATWATHERARARMQRRAALRREEKRSGDGDYWTVHSSCSRARAHLAATGLGMAIGCSGTRAGCSRTCHRCVLMDVYILHVAPRPRDVHHRRLPARQPASRRVLSEADSHLSYLSGKALTDEIAARLWSGNRNLTRAAGASQDAG